MVRWRDDQARAVQQASPDFKGGSVEAERCELENSFVRTELAKSPALDQAHDRPILHQLKAAIQEGAAVHMAHAHAALSGGFGVAIVTAGPGVTNCLTAMANAQLGRMPGLLIGGCAPVAQDDLGPLQGIAHVDIMRPVTRHARTLRVADNVLRDLDKALATAQGDGTVPGPVYVEIPTDVLRTPVAPAVALPEYLQRRASVRTLPDPAAIERDDRRHH